MADGADASHIALVVFQLIGASIYVNCGAVLAKSCRLGELRLVRPDGIGATASGLSLAGIDDINLFYLTVAVPVVLAEVYSIRGCLTTSCRNHTLGVGIIALTIMVLILSVRSYRTKCVRTYYVEGDIELAKTLSREVVADRSLEAALAKILLIGNTIIESLGV